MICPFCNTQNRDDQDICYHCNKDLTMLRLIVNKAKHHYNLALEHAERNRYYEAITELQNALDLDKSYVDARVVLGTIYAKQNNLDKAAAEWEAALATDSHFYKAHQYLLKAQKIGEVLPVLKWVKILGATLVIAILLVITVFIYYNRPHPNEALLREAWSYYQGNNYRQALTALDQIQEKASDQNLLMSSTILRDHIKTTLGTQIATVKNLLANQDYIGTIEAAQSLHQVNPDEETSALLTDLLEQAKANAFQQVEQLIQQYDKSGTGYDDLMIQSQKLIALLGDHADVQQLREKIVQVEEQQLKRAFEKLQKEYKQTRDTKTALAAAQQLLDANPGTSLHEQIQNFMDSARMSSIEYLLGTARSQVEQRAFDKARATLDRILQSSNLSSALRDELATVKAMYDSEQAGDLIQRLKALNAKKEYAQVIKLATEASQFNLTANDRKVIDRETALARRRYAIELYKWMLARDPKFEECRISVEEAQRTVDNYQIVLDYLPKKAYGYAFDEVTFYIGSAFMRLGQHEKGKEFFRKLHSEYSSSSYNKDAEFVLKKFKTSL